MIALTRLADRDRRALRLGAIVVVPAVLLSFLAGPLLEGRNEGRARLAAERALLARELALADGVPAYAATLDELRRDSRGPLSRLLPGDGPILAGAELSGTIDRAAEGGRLSIEALDLLPPARHSDRLWSVGLSFRATGDLEGVLAFLRAVEGAPTLIRADALVLEPVLLPSPVVGGAALEAMHVQATLTGFAAAAAPGAVAVERGVAAGPSSGAAAAHPGTGP